jgi:hypothetical protein
MHPFIYSSGESAICGKCRRQPAPLPPKTLKLFLKKGATSPMVSGHLRLILYALVLARIDIKELGTTRNLIKIGELQNFKKNI